jgi:hypothetical protein
MSIKDDEIREFEIYGGDKELIPFHPDSKDLRYVGTVQTSGERADIGFGMRLGPRQQKSWHVFERP